MRWRAGEGVTAREDFLLEKRYSPAPYTESYRIDTLGIPCAARDFVFVYAVFALVE